MRTTEICVEDWPPFFNDMTQLHHGERVNVETIRKADRRVTPHVRDLPLVGIVAAELKAGAAEWIEIIAGDSAKLHASYSIANPAHVRLAHEDNGQTVAIQIESSKGSITVVRFGQTCEGMPAGFIIE